MSRSISRQTLPGKVYGNLERRSRHGENLQDDDWIYVGSYGTDFGCTPDSPPFASGWVNVGGTNPPLGFFMSTRGLVHLRGSIAGGTIGSTIFTLPDGYAPEYDEHFVVPTNDPAIQAQVMVAAATGNVVLVGYSA